MIQAIIDVGTNTFHLLIVQRNGPEEWDEVYRKREYVYLAQDGIDTLSYRAMTRGLRVLEAFAQAAANVEVHQIMAVGTAALRIASNGEQFIEEVKQKTGIHIQIISGQEEARLTAKGVMAAMPAQLSEYLLMDIGGGSIEFIHIKNDEIIWCESFDIGLSVLSQKPWYTDPLHTESVKTYTDYLSQETASLGAHLSQTTQIPVVGSSGTFEFIIQLMRHQRFERYAFAKWDSANKALKEILHLSYAERHTHPLIPGERAPLLPMALLVIRYIQEYFGSQKLYISYYGLKEGVLLES